MSTMTKLNIVLIVGIILFTIYSVRKAGQKQSGRYNLIKQKKMHNRYVFFSNNIFLRKRFKRIATQFSTISCFTREEMEAKSVELFTKVLLVTISIPVIGAILFQDVILGLFLCLVSLIYYNKQVEDTIDKITINVIQELAESVASINENYLQYDNLQAALLYCDKGRYVRNVLTQIYEIIASPDGANRLYEFCRVTPIRMVRTLAITCYVMNEEGDEKLPEGGSAFTETFTMLREELNSKVREIQRTKLAFKSLPVVTMTGLIVAPIIDWFMLTYLPGTAMYIKGLYGSCEKTILILLTMIGYYLITSYSRVSTVNQVDCIPFILRLSKHKKMKSILHAIMPKKFKTNRKLARLMRDSVTSKTKEYIYTSKLVSSTIGFLVAILALVGFTVSAKSYVWNNYKAMSMESINNDMTEERYQQVKRLDKVYMTKATKMDEEQTVKLVKSYLKGVKDYEATQQAQRLSKKWNVYYSLHFKWYYLVVAYLVGIVCWFIPEISLRLRKKLVTYEAAEDSAQIQSIMIILARTNSDVLKSLYWMTKISVIHKSPLRFAYHEYTSDPEGALGRLKNSVESRELKRIVSKLSTAIYSLSMRESFSDIIMDKRHTLTIRERMRDAAIDSKKNSAKMIASSMLLISIMAGMIVPLGILGITNLLHGFKSI